MDWKLWQRQTIKLEVKHCTMYHCTMNYLIVTIKWPEITFGVAISTSNVMGFTLNWNPSSQKNLLGNTTWAKKVSPTAVFRLIMELCTSVGRAVDCGMQLKKYSKTPWLSCSLYPAPLSTFILQLLPANSAFQSLLVSRALQIRSSPGNF